MPLAFLVSAPGRLLIVGLLVAALSVGLYIQVRFNGYLRADRDHILDINKENLMLADAQAAAARRANQIAASESANAETWRRRYNVIRMEISNAKQDEDGPLAAVLWHALDRLPESDDDEARFKSAAPSAGESYSMPERP